MPSTTVGDVVEDGEHEDEKKERKTTVQLLLHAFDMLVSTACTLEIVGYLLPMSMSTCYNNLMMLFLVLCA